MDIPTGESVQSLLMLVNLLLLAPIWRVLGRIEKKQEHFDQTILHHESRLSYVEGRDDKLFRGN